VVATISILGAVLGLYGWLSRDASPGRDLNKDGRVSVVEFAFRFVNFTHAKGKVVADVATAAAVGRNVYQRDAGFQSMAMNEFLKVTRTAAVNGAVTAWLGLSIYELIVVDDGSGAIPPTCGALARGPSSNLDGPRHRPHRRDFTRDDVMAAEGSSRAARDGLGGRPVRH
jgi:hypothetical protein